MSRIDHVAVEASDPDATAAFYERVFGARVVKAEGHPVMAYLGPTAIAVHQQGGPGPHTAVRVSAEEQVRLRTAPARSISSRVRLPGGSNPRRLVVIVGPHRGPA